ncbi:MAG: hypothetical protein Q9159_006162 [Coniocarpon cinnabarinum]
MNFDLPPELTAYIQRLDAFIAAEITPLQHANDNNRFFDHRREFARTHPDTGLPRKEWHDLLAEAVRRADKAGFYRLSLPKQYGGQNPHGDSRGLNLWMSVIRMHLAAKGLGLFNDLQTEHSVVGNFPLTAMARDHARSLANALPSDAEAYQGKGQRDWLIHGFLDHTIRPTFGLTEPEHGSDATHMATTAVPTTRDGKEGYIINGSKKWQSGMDIATHTFVFARTSQSSGSSTGLTCFLVPVNVAGFKIESYQWTFNMPTDHATITLTDVFVPASAILGVLDQGLAVARAFIHENRIRQAASSLGASQHCIQQSIHRANSRKPFGNPLAANQAIQFPLVELHAQSTALRLLILQTALKMDSMPHSQIEEELGADISVCNYWANRLVCQAADQAMQVFGGDGYSRHEVFEHIYRHHRRYRITEGSEEIQMRRVALSLFGFDLGAKWQQREDAKL